MDLATICLDIINGKTVCPSSIHPVRWRAMIKSANSQIDLIRSGHCIKPEMDEEEIDFQAVKMKDVVHIDLKSIGMNLDI